jgi:hypothetical protein
MNATLATQNPTFHALTGEQAVGRTQIAAQADYAGTITSVTRINTTYWSVTTRTARDAFSAPKLGASCAIWAAEDGRYVVDYYDTADGGLVEVDRTHSLQAAIGVAASSTAQRWATGPYAR